MTEETSDIIIVIDASIRDLSMYTCAVTVLHEKLVLRKGTEIGSMHDIKTSMETRYPILIIGEYQAQSSAGFTKVLADLPVCEIAGGVGFAGFIADHGYVTGDSLRPFSTEGTLIPNGGKITMLETSIKNSNHRTAEAVKTGLCLSAKMQGHIIIAEGQSDYVAAWKIVPTNSIDYDRDPVEFPVEHRADIFGEKDSVVPDPVPVREERSTTATLCNDGSTSLWDLGSGSIAYDNGRIYITADPDGRGENVEISFAALVQLSRKNDITTPSCKVDEVAGYDGLTTYKFGRFEVDMDDINDLEKAIKELGEIQRGCAKND